MTRRTWLKSRHIQLSPAGSEQSTGVVESHLKILGLTRTLPVRVGYLEGLAELVAKTKLVASLPEAPAEVLSERHDLRCWPHPIRTFPGADVRMSWHATQEHDAGYQWFRSQVVEAIQKFTE